MTMIDKTHFRKTMRALRDGLVQEDKAAASRRIAEHVYAWRNIAYKALLRPTARVRRVVL
jgi:hypothetical protein